MAKQKYLTKVLALICSLSVVMSSVFVFDKVIEVNASTTGNIEFWNGEIASAFAGGIGSSTEPYQITNGAELAYMLESSTNNRGKYYKIMNDIYLNDISSEDWENKSSNLNKWLDGKQFFGFLDGDNHIVHGIYYPDTSKTWVGLIPQILAASGTSASMDGSKASIKNIGIKNSYIQGTYAGALVGKSDTDNGILIENCFADATVTVKGTNREGFVATNGKKNVTIKNCYFTGELSGTAAQGSAAILGYIDASSNNTSKIINCYGVVTNGASYITSKINPESITYENVYGNRFWYNFEGITHVNENNMQGEKALTYMVGFDFDNVWRVGSEGKYPTLKSFPVIEEDDEPKNPNVWDGNVATSFAAGTGSESDPYQINNGAELAYMLESSTNNRGKYYKIMNDIYLNDINSADWENKTSNLNKWLDGKQFFGFLDGDSHIVHGIYYPDTSKTWVGLIPQILAASGTTASADGSKASIKNIGIKNSYIQGTYAGALVGKPDTDNGILIENCFADETVMVKGTNREGFVATNGKKNVTIKNCYFTGELSGTAAQGSAAILGYIDASSNNTSKIINCYGVVTNGASYITSKTNPENITYENVYGNRFWYNFEGITHVNENNMQGEKALTYMVGFDFDNVWRIGSEGEYLTLKSFPVIEEDDESKNPNVWDGNVATSFAAGTGSESDPYQITKGSELALMLNSSLEESKGKYFKITKDIYLNDTENPDWKKQNPNEWYSGKTFYGNLDGDCHIIYGVYYAEDKTGWSALIPILEPTESGGYIKNLGLRDSQIIGDRSGGLVGKVNSENGATITNCFVDDTVSLKGVYSEGGIISWISGYYNVLVKNCYTKATFSGKASQGMGGLLGYFDYAGKAAPTEKEKLRFNDCYAITNNSVPVCYTGDATKLGAYFNDCYGNICDEKYDYVTYLPGMNILPEEKMQGASAEDNMIFFDFEEIWVAGAEGEYPTLKIFGFTNEDDDEDDKEDDKEDEDVNDDQESTDNSKVWNGTIASKFAVGTGTEEDPYQISKGSELALMLNLPLEEAKGKYFKITKDIYLNDTENPDWKKQNPNEWYSGKTFYGNLDGDCHIIYGVYYSEDKTGWSALIPIFEPTESGGYIKNLGLRDSQIIGERSGGLVGKVNSGNGATITNCFVDDTVSLKGVYSEGGIISWISGYYNVLVKNCYTKATFSGKASQGMGGLLGHFDYAGKAAPTEKEKLRFNDCYAITNNNVPVCYTGDATKLGAYFNDCYGNICDEKYDYVTYLPGMNILPEEKMQGASAETNMIFFDFNETWFTGKSGEYPTLLVFGKTDVYGGGDGTKNNPYLITNKDELERLRTAPSATTLNKYFALANDIVVNDTSKTNWKKHATNWENDDATMFKGSFDGRGHTVSGIYINSDFLYYAGLFARVSKNVVIENIGIINSYIKGNNAGAITGNIYGENVTIRKCFADETTEVHGIEKVGGLVGIISRKYFTLTNCFFTGNLKGKSVENKGGLIGFASLATSDDLKTITVSKCYVYTKSEDDAVFQMPIANMMRYVDVYTSLETKVEYETAVKLDDVRAIPLVIKKEDFIGKSAESAMDGLDFNSVWISVKDKTPMLRIFTVDGEPELVGKKDAIWSGKIATKFAGGKGTQKDPYIIETAEQLALLINTSVSEPMQTANKYYRLDADIKLNDTHEIDWYKKEGNNQWFNDYSYKSLGFRGYFDGNGHIIDGLYAESDFTKKEDKQKCYGLFPALGGNAIVKSVAVTNVYLNGGHRMGCIAGFISIDSNTYNPESDVDERIRISQCVAQSEVAITGGTVGGILGHAARPVLLEDCLSQVCPLAEHAQASLIGTCDSSVNSGPSEMRNCLVIHSADKKTEVFWKSDSGATPIVTNVYSPYTTNGGTVYGMSTIWGDKAKDTLKGFDFNNIWKTVVTGTPVLRVFNTDSHSVEKQKVSISFFTYGGTNVETVTGYPGEKIKWPNVSKIKRDADVLEGWYLEPEFLRKFDVEVFPDYNVILYAKWSERTIRQDFEKYPYGFAGYEGLGLDYERYRPGVVGYEMKYVHDGLASIHRIGKDKDAGEQDFQIFQSDFDPLEIGQDYELTFWIYPESIIDTTKMLKLVHMDYLEVENNPYALQKLCDLDNLKLGGWQEIKIKFTANSYYLAIRTPAECSLYFDTFKIVPLGTSGEVESEMIELTKTVTVKKYMKKKANNTSKTDTFYWLPFAIIVAVIVVFSATIVTTIIIKKKRRKN